jgi:retron-type reverse transcriptase
VPTISDRIAQTVVKQMIEPEMEHIFLLDSYRLGRRERHASAVLEI